MTVDGIVDSVLNFGETVESIREQFGVPVETTRTLIDYARALILLDRNMTDGK